MISQVPASIAFLYIDRKVEPSLNGKEWLIKLTVLVLKNKTKQAYKLFLNQHIYFSLKNVVSGEDNETKHFFQQNNIYF